MGMIRSKHAPNRQKYAGGSSQSYFKKSYFGAKESAFIMAWGLLGIGFGLGCIYILLLRLVLK